MRDVERATDVARADLLLLLTVMREFGVVLDQGFLLPPGWPVPAQVAFEQFSTSTRELAMALARQAGDGRWAHHTPEAIERIMS